ncbi:hypothetical protein HON22_03435 [Candidatus Peregrinibacteria bacterium]|jgi:hypothetical protein|nr:hypothetical protein [Candidatus Peregrinibacteria bacterium]
MRHVAFIAFIITLIVGLAGLIMFAPYHIYILAIEEGIDSEYFSFSDRLDTFTSSKTYKIGKNEVVSFSENDQLWKSLHFNNFELPLPIRHPLMRLRPTVELNKKELNFHLQFKDNFDVTFLSLTSEATFQFTPYLGNQKLFYLPYFKEMILSKSESALWKDIFSRDIKLPRQKNDGLLDYAKKIWNVPYEELVYNLYILQMREKYLPKKVNQFAFYKLGEQEVAIATTKNESELELDNQYLFIRTGKTVYSLKLMAKKFHSLSKFSIRKIIKNIKIKKTNPDASTFLYSFFRSFDIDRRGEDEAMVYLYLAWIHDPSKKEYLREIIFYMEREKRNIKEISPLYDLAYKLYGTNFSNDKEKLKESSAMLLKRKIREELNEDIKRETATDLKVKDEFKNTEEKINFYLNKAKEENQNSDQEESTLIQY